MVDPCEYSTDFGIYRVKSGLACLTSMENSDPDLLFELSSVKSDSLAVKPLETISLNSGAGLTSNKNPVFKSLTSLPDKREIFPRFPSAAVQEAADFNPALQSICAG